MKKVIVIGNCGAGKSRFAAALGNKLHLPVVHLDKLYWKKGWVRTSKEDWEKIQHELVQKREWIIDGNYQSTLDLRLKAADTILFLDFPKWLCLYRAMKRRIINRRKPRPDIPQELHERITFGFVKWILTYPRKDVYMQIEKLQGNQQVLVLHNPKELAHFLSDCATWRV